MADRAEKCADNVWRDMDTAPKTGEHILAARFTGDGVGFGYCGDKLQSLFAVVHWWNEPGEEGWYPSFGPDTAMYFTHWQPLLEYPEGRSHYPDDRELLEAAKAALKLYDSVPREAVEIMELFNAMERLRTAIERKG